jgi:hypothetical protein
MRIFILPQAENQDVYIRCNTFKSVDIIKLDNDFYNDVELLNKEYKKMTQ